MESETCMMKEPMQPKGDLELYKKAVEIHKSAYKKPTWNKEKYNKKVGFMLRSMFEEGVWTFKDLNDKQLLLIIEIATKKDEKKRSRFRPIIQALD